MFSKPSAIHYDTPLKAKVQGAHQYLSAKGFPHDVRDIFKEFDVRSERAGYKMLEEGASPRKRHHISEINDTRGRKSKVTREQVREADQILQQSDLELEGKRYTWDQIAMEVGAEVVGRTIHKILRKALDYEKCLACVKGWLDETPMERRVEYASVMKARYPKSED